MVQDCYRDEYLLVKVVQVVIETGQSAQVVVTVLPV